MANDKVFSKKADNYSKGRQGYAPEAIDLIFRQLMPAGGTAADIGAGTGMLSREFLARGIPVYCVEPNADMLARARSAYGEDPNFFPVDASAEQTGLADSSIQLITAASAFHWFDMQAFRRECMRILAPGGKVCILNNARDYHDDFTQKQHEICQRCCPKFTSLRHGQDKSERIMDAFFGTAPTREEFSFPLTYSKENFLQRCLSSSYAPLPGDETYDLYIRLLTELTDKAADGDSLTVANSTIVYWGQMR